ncbi:MAG: hypothetical protein E7306_03575 [Butyrivibrio sp.]|nr:hypothetical protein [Butyrivibrio sp.]
MSYDKHTWQDRELITDTSLNHLEDGVKENDENLDDYKVENQATIEELVRRITEVNSQLSIMDDNVNGLYNHVASAVGAEESRAQTAEGNLSDSVSAERTRAEGVESTLSGNISSESSRAQIAEAALQALIDTLNGTGNGSVYKAVNDEKTRAQIAEAALSGAIDTLNGSGAGSVSKAIDDAIAAVIADAPASFDTLKEISDWISSHADSAAALNSLVQTLSGNLSDHTADTSNPHNVTKTQVGLGNVPNVSTNDQTPTYTEAASNTELTSGETLSTAFGKIAKAIKSFIAHLADTSNPHRVTKSQLGINDNISQWTNDVGYITEADIPSAPVTGVKGDGESNYRTGNVNITKSNIGLGNVPNVTTNNQTVTYTAASENAELVSGEVLSTAFGKIAKAISSLISHLANTSNPHSVTKTQVGLGNVENKSSATIRSELTKANVTDALGYTPPTTNTTYGVATTSANGLLKKLDGDATHFMNGAGNWAVPPTGGGSTPLVGTETITPSSNGLTITDVDPEKTTVTTYNANGLSYTEVVTYTSGDVYTISHSFTTAGVETITVTKTA